LLNVVRALLYAMPRRHACGQYRWPPLLPSPPGNSVLRFQNW